MKQDGIPKSISVSKRLFTIFLTGEQQKPKLSFEQYSKFSFPNFSIAYESFPAKRKFFQQSNAWGSPLMYKIWHYYTRFNDLFVDSKQLLNPHAIRLIRCIQLFLASIIPFVAFKRIALSIPQK